MTNTPAIFIRYGRMALPSNDLVLATGRWARRIVDDGNQLGADGDQSGELENVVHVDGCLTKTSENASTLC